MSDTITATPRKVRPRSYDRLPFSPLTGRGLVGALEEANAQWHALRARYPLDFFPLDTFSERLKEHNAEHPDLWAASVMLSHLGDAITRRIDK